MDLNNLLLRFGTKLASRWYQLGIAVGISEEVLDECSNHAPQEAVGEVLDYWMKNNHDKSSWEEFVAILDKIGFHGLANN